MNACRQSRLQAVLIRIIFAATVKSLWDQTNVSLYSYLKLKGLQLRHMQLNRTLKLWLMEKKANFSYCDRLMDIFYAGFEDGHDGERGESSGGVEDLGGGGFYNGDWFGRVTSADIKPFQGLQRKAELSPNRVDDNTLCRDNPDNKRKADKLLGTE